MGGSFALALKRAGLVKRVVGYSTTTSTLERALQLGVIDVGVASAQLAASGADIVLVAVPVGASEDTFKAIQPAVSPTTLIMDVGSTKSDVVEAARRGLGEHIGTFVPAHPIAGKELAGVAHADANLYRDKQVILTPTESTLPAQFDAAVAVWTALGANVVQMSPESHDAAFAAVSHLPHLLAFAMMNGIKAQPEGQNYLALAGPGFRDFSRIAGSDPKVWRDILGANRSLVLAQSRLFRDQLQAFETALQSGDTQTLESLITQASALHTHWRMNR